MLHRRGPQRGKDIDKNRRERTVGGLQPGVTLQLSRQSVKQGVNEGNVSRAQIHLAKTGAKASRSQTRRRHVLLVDDTTEKTA